MTAKDPVLTVLGDSTLRLDPGVEGRARLRIRNIGDIIEKYRIEILGDAAPWTRLDSRSRNFEPSASGGVGAINIDKATDEEIGLVFLPPADGTAPAGLVVVGVRVFSTGNATGSVAEIHLQVGGVSQLRIAISPSERKARWSARYSLTLENGGNDRAKVELVGADTKEELTVIPAEKVLTVPAGGRMATTVRVRACSPRISGRPESHQFSVVAKERLGGGRLPVPGSEPTAVASFQERAVLGGFAPAALMGVVAVIVALGLLLRPKGDAEGVPAPPAAPTLIHSTTPSSIELSWPGFAPGSYGDAFRVSFFANGGPVGVAATTEGVQQPQVSITQDVNGAPVRPGTKYCFTLQVLVSKKPGKASPETCAVIPEVRVPAPAVDATVAGDDKIKLEWPDIEAVDDFVLLSEGRREEGVSSGVTVKGEPGEEVCAEIVARIGDAESKASRACAVLPTPDAGGAAGGPTGPGSKAGTGGSAGTPGGGSGPSTGTAGPTVPSECQLDGFTVTFFLVTNEAGDTNQKLFGAFSAVKALYETDEDPKTDPARVAFGTTDNLGFPQKHHGLTIAYVDGIATKTEAQAQAKYIKDNTDPAVVPQTAAGEQCKV